jgi:hypothetical protein
VPSHGEQVSARLQHVTYVTKLGNSTVTFLNDILGIGGADDTAMQPRTQFAFVRQDLAPYPVGKLLACRVSSPC